LLDEFKESLHDEIKDWQILFANGVLESSKLKYLCKYIAEKYSIISAPINDLVDARKVIICLEELENNLTDLDNDIEITVDVYDLLSEYQVPIKPDDERQLNILTETYKKLKLEVTFINHNDIQTNIKSAIPISTNNIKIFALFCRCATYHKDCWIYTSL